MTGRPIAIPRWLKPMNRVFVALSRAGLSLGGMTMLTVPGRVSGAPRTTPVTVMRLDGRRYLVAGIPGADWVKNLRVAGHRATLTTGRAREEALLAELPEDEARPVLRAFPTEVPTGVDMMRRSGVVDTSSPDEFEALAGTCPVFRIDPA